MPDFMLMYSLLQKIKTYGGLDSQRPSKTQTSHSYPIFRISMGKRSRFRYRHKGKLPYHVVYSQVLWLCLNMITITPRTRRNWFPTRIIQFLKPPEKKKIISWSHFQQLSFGNCRMSAVTDPKSLKIAPSSTKAIQQNIAHLSILGPNNNTLKDLKASYRVKCKCKDDFASSALNYRFFARLYIIALDKIESLEWDQKNVRTEFPFFGPNFFLLLLTGPAGIQPGRSSPQPWVINLPPFIPNPSRII